MDSGTIDLQVVRLEDLRMRMYGNLPNPIARFRDVQWRQIWCIVGLKVDVNKTTAVRGTVKRINQ